MIDIKVKDLNDKLKDNKNNSKSIKIGTITISSITAIALGTAGIYIGQKVNIGQKIQDLLNSFHHQNKQIHVKKNIHHNHHFHKISLRKNNNIKKALENYKQNHDNKSLYKEIEQSQSYSDLIKNIQKLKQLNEIVKQNGNYGIKIDKKPIDQEIKSTINDLAKIMYVNKCILNNEQPTTDNFLEYTAGILKSNVVGFSNQQFEKLSGKTFSDKFLNGYKELIQKIQNDFEKTYFSNPKIPEKIKEHLRGQESIEKMTNVITKLNKLIKEQQRKEKTDKILGVVDF